MRKFTENRIDFNKYNLNSELISINENNKQVGSLILCYLNEKANIFSLSILEKYRGKGYGKKLIIEAIEHARKRGLKILELNTEVDNTVANKLYKSMGFQFNGLLDDYNNYTLYI